MQAYVKGTVRRNIKQWHGLLYTLYIYFPVALWGLPSPTAMRSHRIASIASISSISIFTSKFHGINLVISHN